MSELRKDYILNRYSIIAAERGKRPDLIDPASMKKDDIPAYHEKCPFCAGNEHLLLSITHEMKKDDNWIIRVVPNKFSAVSLEGDPEVKTHNKFFTFAAGYGVHDVIVECPQHNVELEMLSQEHICSVLQTYCIRIKELNDLPNIKFVSVFKNRGKAAGASIPHSHSQVIAYNLKPSWIQEELMAFYDYVVKNESCPYCEIIEIEKHSDRAILESENFVVFTPYASRFPYAVQIFPKQHLPNMVRLDNHQLFELAGILKKLLTRLDALGYPPYNLKVHNAEPEGENFHFHIEISPRMAIWAGFELETGTVINTVSPEDAARFYREGL